MWGREHKHVDKKRTTCYNYNMNDKNKTPEHEPQETPPWYDARHLKEAAEDDLKLHERLLAVRLAEGWLVEEDTPANREAFAAMEQVALDYCEQKGLLPPSDTPSA